MPQAFNENPMTSAREATEAFANGGASDPFTCDLPARPSRVRRIRRLAVQNRDVIATVATSFGISFMFGIQGIFLARLLGPEMRAEYGTVVLYTQTLTFIGLLGTLLSIASHAALEPRPASGASPIGSPPEPRHGCAHRVRRNGALAHCGCRPRRPILPDFASCAPCCFHLTTFA